MTKAHEIKNLTFFRAIWPKFVQILLSISIGPINAFIISLISDTSLESLVTASVLINILLVLLTFFSFGSFVVIGQYIGQKGNRKLLKKAVDSTFWLTIIQALVVVCLLLVLNKYLLNWWGLNFGSKQNDEASMYIYVIAPSIIFLSLENYCLGILEAYGRPYWLFIIGVPSLIFGATLSLILVYYTPLGVLAPAIGTVCARLISFVLATIIYSIYIQPFWKIRGLNRKISRKIIWISLPISSDKTSYDAGSFVRSLWFGPIAISLGLIIQDGKGIDKNIIVIVRNIYASLQVVTTLGCLSISLGMQVYIARLIGEGNFPLVKKKVALAYLMALGIDLTIAFILWLISPFLVNFLMNQEKNQKIIDLVQARTWPVFGWLILLTFGRVTRLIYLTPTQSAGDTRFNAIVSIVINWICAVLLAIVFAYYLSWGSEGIIIGMTLDEVIRGFFTYWRWKSNRWQTKVLKIEAQNG